MDNVSGIFRCHNPDNDVEKYQALNGAA